MKIAVCLKRVPDTATKIRIGADDRSIDASDVQFVISPYDEYAVEEALVLRDATGDGDVTVFCLGPGAAQQVIRQALAMGADKGVLIKHEGEDLDPFQVARNLANAIAEGGFDLVLFGRQTVDSQSGAVGPMTSRLLGFPCITDVVKVELADGVLKAEREGDNSKEILEMSLPATLTAQKGLNEPRYASLKGIMAAKKKPIDERGLDSVDPRHKIKSLQLPPPRPEGKIVGEGVEAVPELVRLLREEAKVL